MSAAPNFARNPLPIRVRRLAAGAAVAGLAMASVLTAAFAPGCGGSNAADYYCDATGCYQCDGFGCSTVTPPTPTPCTKAGDTVCTDGTVCTDQGCLLACAQDAVCAKGFTCRSGFCEAPTATTPKPLVCAVATDCGASGYDCVAGSCVAVPACTGVGCTCKYTSECGTGRVCANGACVEACDASTPCATGFNCNADGVCVRASKAVCGVDANGATCPSGQQCVDGQCAAGCTSGSQCLGADGQPDPQQQCLGGACVPNTHPITKCNGNAQCAANQTCLDGFCRYTCTTDNQCKSIDARIGTCAKDGVCRSSAEASAQCTAQADCASGQSCINGQCM